MDLESNKKLRLDRRLTGRRGWIDEKALQASLEELPDVSDKVAPPEFEEPEPVAEPSPTVATEPAPAPASSAPAFTDSPPAPTPSVPIPPPRAVDDGSEGGAPV